MDSDDSDSREKVNEAVPSPGVALQETMESDSEEEEPIVIQKKKKVNQSVLADSDEESDGQQTMSEDKPVEQEAVEDEVQEEVNTEGKTGIRKRIAVLDSSESEEEEDTEAQEKTGLETENSESTEETVPSNKPRILKNTELLDELFDAEESDEGENNSDDEDNSQEKTGIAMDEGYHGDNGESEEEAEPQISEALRQKLAKGAAKKPKASRSRGNKPHRMKKEDIQQIHSESQRIMREREVKMPYHQPKKLGLSVFLARTQQKQEALKKITPGRWKQPDSALLLTSKLDEQNLTKNNKNIEANTEKSLDNTTDTQVTCSKTAANTEVEQVKKQLDLDDLPDLVIEKSSACVEDPVMLVASSGKTVKAPRLDALSQKDLPMDNKMTDEVREIASDNAPNDCNDMNLGDINQESGVQSLKASDKVPEQDSGYLTTPLNSSEEESTGSHSESGDSQDKTGSCLPSTNMGDSEVNMISKDNSNDATVHINKIKGSEELKIANEDIETVKEVADEKTNYNSGMTTPGSNSEGCVKPKQRKTPVLSSTALPAPRLSGNPDSFIVLDDDNDGAEALDKSKAGLKTLMERLMKHSAKRPHRKAKDVEISMVVKEQGCEKEELKLDKFTYHVDAEEEEDPALHVPGAKLLKLKEKLKEKMTADREKARQLRSQLMDFDNDENGFEEEGELTDQTDTDEEVAEEDEDEEEVEEEEEEMDMEEYTDREKANRENNPFVDDEAESEGEEEDDIEESGLHLQLDSIDSKGCDDSTGKSEVPRKDYLKSALSKTKSMDLFDEEANTDSPTMSQQSSADSNIDISDRPFEQLSQGTQLVSDDTTHKTSAPPTECNNTNSVSLFRDTSFNMSMDTSFDLMGSMIPAGQGTGKKHRQEGDSPCSKSSAQSSRRYSVLSLPVENTQDLFTFSETSPTEYPQQATQSKDLHFHMDESQSRLLDDDGLLKLESTKKSSRRQLIMDEKESTDQDDEMELLGLCSGRFTENKEHSSKKSLFSGDSQMDSSQSMNELMGLCSGQFSGIKPTAPLSRSSSAATESSSILLRSDSTEPFMPGTQSQHINELLHLCSGTFTGNKDTVKDSSETQSQKTRGEEEETDNNVSQKKSKSRKKKRKRIMVGSDDDSDGGEHVNDANAEDSDDFEVQSNQGSDNEEVDELASDEDQPNEFTGFKKDGKLLQQFVDEEAELSGSEAESDENYDVDEEEDMLEMEEGDNDVTLNNEELRNQVGRVHLKSVIDADKRQIRLMQEMYLADGDLHSEGGGRQRKFRWRNIDDATQDDLFRDGSDEEVAEDDADQEKWRLQRFEREKFLQEMKENEENKPDAQPIKLGNVCFKPKKLKSQQLKSSENLVKESDKDVQKSKPSVPSQVKPAVSSSQGLFKVPTKRAGSFLSRSKSDLAKIAEMSKPVGSVSGPRNSRKFVFQTLSEESKTEDSADKKPAVKRANSTPKQPVAKKPKLEKSSSMPKDSIFNLY